MSGPPPPPPPHGGVPRGSGLPPGKYDIFVIPEHSAGAGFLYLPSMQPNVNSFAAGFASALILVAVFQSMAPAFRAWWDGFQGLGNMGITMIVIGVGFGAWSLGRIQQSGSTPKHGPSTSYDSSGGYGGTSSRTSANTGRPPPHGNSTPPPPPPHSDPPPQPPPQQERTKNNWEGPPPQHTPPPPNSDPPPRPQPPPQPPPQTPPETPPPKPKARRPSPPQSPKTEPPPKRKESSSWEKAREEMRKKEEERKVREAEQKRRDEAARRLAELRAREAKERQEREKERQRREREAQEREEHKQREAKERRERLEAEQRAKELAEKLDHERKERERLEKEAREIREAVAAKAAEDAKAAQEAKEKEEQRQREAKEREEKRKREAQEREERRKRLQQQREEMRKREAEEARKRDEAKKKKEDEERQKAEEEARVKAEAEAKAAEAEAHAKAEAEAKARAQAEIEAQTQARKGSSYAFAGVGERTSMWPNGRPPVAKSNVSNISSNVSSNTSSSTPKPPPTSAPTSAPTAAPSTTSKTPPPPSTSQSNVSSSSKGDTTPKTEEHSYRPYDKIRARRKKSVSSMTGSESSWAGTHTTSRTSPPPSVRGAYTTNDPDKIVISAVYLFMNQFAKTPASQLISGIGSVTDGLILRITTEGLFIDDDVRGVPQREWDVKAWTLKLTEVWCPPHCLNNTNPAPPPAAKANPLLYKMATSRARDRGATKPLTGDEADVYLTEMLRACSDCCKLGLCERKFRDTNIPSSTGQGGEWKAKSLHLLRATVRDQEGKRYVFVIDETEAWKVAVGVQRLRRGTQVRQLGVSGMASSEARGTLEMLGWAS